jgi:Spy/CpxP family protein refolding chaperone
MNKRGLAIRLAAVGVVAAAGVAIAASPASAMEAECFDFAYWNHRSEQMLQDPSLTGAQWMGWFNLWVRSGVALENC